MLPKFAINIEEINNEDNTQIQKKIKAISLPINDFNKKILILKENKSTTIGEFLKINNILENSNSSNISEMILFIQNNIYSFDSSNISNSTICDSKTLITINNSIIEKEINNSIFNRVRINFYSKNKLNDIPLYIEYNEINIPPRYMIDEINFVFLYNNEIITYCAIISGVLKTENIKTNPSLELINKKDNFYALLGLYFCGEEIEITTKNGIHRYRCEPNNFLCRKCVDLNKILYNLKNHYLVNINGRIAKMNKGKYHCFGHFLYKNQIEDCINKFCCKACQILNLYSEYFTKN